MTELLFILAPLLVLPVVLLFRFVGCSEIAGLDDTPATTPAPAPIPPPVIPNYRDTILKDAAGIIGYWRLVDLYNDAFDETGKHAGSHRSSADPDVAPGGFILGQNSLVQTKPAVACRFYNGGYVVIPPHPDLFTDEFTIEAWVRPDFAAGQEHTVFHAGGFYRRPFETNPAYHGFRIYATTGRTWQVDLAASGAVLPAPPLIPAGAFPTHLAVSVQRATPSTTRVALYIGGKLAAENSTLPFYPRPDGAPLLMARGARRASRRTWRPRRNPTSPRLLRGALQEVVLYRTVRTPAQIDAHAKPGGVT
ncbi:MAG: LamG domain-containing protein [Rhodospirillaceae bacterium]|nr:LamG domain-containing protein [Rhodospirillaceae bacterium]